MYFRIVLSCLLIGHFSCQKADPVPNAHRSSAIVGAQVDGELVRTIAALINPQKLDTLKGKRAATPRLRKVGYWLHRAGEPAATLEAAQRTNGDFGTPRGIAVSETLMRNLTILQRLGCLEGEGLEKLRRGKAPTVLNGPYAGDIASVDHIIPRSVCGELDNRLYNLEFLPSKLNGRKNDSVGDRQRQLAEKWHAAGLLSDVGLRQVMGGS